VTASADDRPTATPAQARERLEQALFEIRRVIAGQDAMLERVLVCLLAQGHLLIEGVPGLAKTLTIKTTAAVLGGTFSRIQFTPDLVPSDLVGTRVYRSGDGTFDTELGPVFCNFLLADEINRAPAKVQSALLEVMQEHQVTIGKQSWPVPAPFLVLATQNPIESDGTYPLPEAQVDRFLMKVVVEYPNFSEEMTIVARSLTSPPTITKILSLDQLQALQTHTANVYVDRLVAEYAVALCDATRHPASYNLPDLSGYIAYGASPRGSINLVAAARALAVLRGRSYALPQDVQELARDVLRHRLVLTYQALAEQVTPDTLLTAVLNAIPPPRIDLAREQPA
jgi:MoxR-like ATPase